MSGLSCTVLITLFLDFLILKDGSFGYNYILLVFIISAIIGVMQIFILIRRSDYLQ